MSRNISLSGINVPKKNVSSWGKKRKQINFSHILLYASVRNLGEKMKTSKSVSDLVLLSTIESTFHIHITQGSEKNWDPSLTQNAAYDVRKLNPLVTIYIAYVLDTNGLLMYLRIKWDEKHYGESDLCSQRTRTWRWI